MRRVLDEALLQRAVAFEEIRLQCQARLPGKSNLPSPVDRQDAADGSVQFIGGEPAEVVVSLTETSVIVSEFSGVWESPFTFAARPRRVGVVKWRRLPETALLNALSALVKGAREARLSRFQVCRYCGRNTAPEWMRGRMHGPATTQAARATT